jgi:hypothetical protein
MNNKDIILSMNEQQRREFFIKKNYKNIYDEIILFNEKNLKCNLFSQMIYNYVYDIKEHPLCKCGEKLKYRYFTVGYNIYCSKKCMMSDEKIVQKRNDKSKKTCLEKYGVDNASKTDSVKIKIINTNLERYGKISYTQTDKFKNDLIIHNIEKYGKEYYFQTNDYKEKVKNYSQLNFGVDHYSQSNHIKNKKNKTCLEKYGNINPLCSKEIKEKSIRTNLKKYGYTNHMIFKKENNLLSDFFKNLKINYYKKLSNDSYNILNINENDTLDINHNGIHVFNISKQLFYLRNKKNVEVCTICNPLNGNNVSYMEKDLLNFIKENYNSVIIENDKKIINPYELDIYLPDLNLAFEFNGLYWHNELNKPNNYHKMKTDLCLEKGIHLVHIYEDDWVYKQGIVKSMILNKLNKTKYKIFARKCEIKDVTDNNLIRDFLNDNHIQGFVGSKVKIGLFYDNELISLMTFGKLRKPLNSKSKNNNEYEMLRFCNKLNTNIIGGASKLFKYFINKYDPEQVISYADRSYSNGNLYNILGFKFDHITSPNYYYIIDKIRKHRFGFRKDILIKQGYDTNKSEHDIMLEREYYRIYNSGNYKFLYEPSKKTQKSLPDRVQ